MADLGVFQNLDLFLDTDQKKKTLTHAIMALIQNCLILSIHGDLWLKYRGLFHFFSLPFSCI